jgi:hypothetical protein
MAKPLPAAGWAVGRDKARRVLRQAGMVGRRPIRRRPGTTDSHHGDRGAPHLLARPGEVDTPEQGWAGEIP